MLKKELLSLSTHRELSLDYDAVGLATCRLNVDPGSPSFDTLSTSSIPFFQPSVPSFSFLQIKKKIFSPLLPSPLEFNSEALRRVCVGLNALLVTG